MAPSPLEIRTMDTHDIPYKDYDHAAKMAAGFSFTIDTEGRWYCHDPNMGAGPIRRDSLAKLFAGAGSGFMAGKGLSITLDGRYLLTSPPDTYGVDVEDVPFLIVSFERLGDDFKLITNFDEAVMLDKIHALCFRPAGPFPEIPYIEVRQGLMARLSRSVFYDLCNIALTEAADDTAVFIESGGARHALNRTGS